MANVTRRPRVVLIGGTSHVGKSTFARALAQRMGWEYLSTDSFARHPGRPWRDDGEVPEIVQAYYGSRKPDTLLEEVMEHYRKHVWPIAQAVVRARISNAYDSCLVLEGSAIWPDCVVESGIDGVWSTWLTARPELIAERIRVNSRFAERTTAQQALIEAFTHRSLAFDVQVMNSVRRLAQRSADVSTPDSLDAMSQACMRFATG